MGHQIIKQPDGKFCVFSTVVDDFVMADATPAEIIEDYVEHERQRITEDVSRIVGQLEAQQKPYYQFTMTYEEACRKIDTVHGKDRSKIQS